MASRKTEGTVSKTAASTTKKAAAKTAEKKDVKTEVKSSVYVEYGSGQIDVKNILQDVIAANSAEGGEAPKSVEIYIKPEENAAYYVINGKSEGKKIDLYF